MAPVPALTKVFFKTPVFGVMAMDVAETIAAVRALSVATSVAATTVGGATGRMVIITRASDNTAHSVHIDNIAALEDLAVVVDKP